MLQYLPALDAYLWLTTAGWQIVVAAIVLFRPSLRRAYPAFSSFAYFAAIRSMILIVLPGRFYFIGYAIGSTTTALLIGAVLFELYARVCGPNFSLPSWVPRTMMSWLLVAVSISLAATFGLYTVRQLPRRAAVLAAAQGGMLMVLFLGLTLLFLYSRHLGMEWRMRPKQIAVGLTIYLSVNTIVLFLFNHVPRELTPFLDRISQSAALMSLIWWTFTLMRREPAPEPVTQEIIDTILAFHQETVEAAESVGLVQPVK